MNNSISVKPNQSVLDVIIMSCGTLEAGMQMMMQNGTSISDLPNIGDTFTIPEHVTTDNGALEYLYQNSIVIGTRGIPIPPPPPLSMQIVLYPVMQVVPRPPSTPPAVLGYWDFDFTYDAGFINVYPFVSSGLGANAFVYQGQSNYFSHLPPSFVTGFGSPPPMSARTVNYHIPHDPASLMMIWSDPAILPRTLTYTDVNGNHAYVSPVIVMDTITQHVENYLVADLQVDFIATDGYTITLRLTRSHPAPSGYDFNNRTMHWLLPSGTTTPDPADPSNPDKIYLTLTGPGNYTMGVKTEYTNIVLLEDYPPSEFTMVIEVN